MANIPNLMNQMGNLEVMKIPKIFEGEWAKMKLTLRNGEIIGADNTIFNGTCIDQKDNVVYAEIRNPWIEGKIELA